MTNFTQLKLNTKLGLANKPCAFLLMIFSLFIIPNISSAQCSGSELTGTTDILNNYTTGTYSYSELDVDGTGVNFSLNVTGETTGVITQIQGGSFNGVSGLDLRSQGFTTGATFTIMFSQPVNSVSFDLGHVNGSSGGGGDKFVISGLDGLSNTIVPTVDETNDPSNTYDVTTNATNVEIDSNGNGGTPGNATVSFSDPDGINSFTIFWNECDICAGGFHGGIISDMTFCVDAPAPQLDVTKTASPSGDVSPGDTVTYTINVDNTGTVNAENVTVDDVLPTGVTYDGGTAMKTYWVNSASSSFTHSMTPANQTFTATGLTQSYTVTAADIPAGAIITSYSYDVTVSTTDWLSEISLLGTYPGGTVNGSSFGGNVAGTNINQTGSGTISGLPSALGTYTFVWDDANDFGGTFNTVNSASFTINYITRTQITDAANAPTNMVIPLDAIILEPGETMSVTFDVTVDAGASGTLTNNVNVGADGSPVFSDNVSNTVIAVPDPCDAVASGNPDNDGDGVSDICDEDDDNDGILDSNELYCNQSTYANSNFGTGAFQEQLYIFDWSNVGANLNNGDTQTFTINDLIITATFSNVAVTVGSGNITPTDMMTWAEARISELYNTPGGNEALYGSALIEAFSFTVDFVATKNGVPYPLNIIAFDAESTTDNGGESISFQSNGGDWTFLEGIDVGAGTLGDFTLNSNTLTVNDTFDANEGNSLYVSEGATSINVSVVSPGTAQQAVGFAIRLSCDTDADGIVNSLDTDSDNDGCPDALEGGDNIPLSSVDGNGRLTGTADASTNGVPNNVSSTTGQSVGASTNASTFDSFGQCDSDNDGTVDANDLCPGSDDNANADGDSVPDGCDEDDDNDGILDVNEGFSITTNSAPACGTQTILNFNNPFTEESGDGNAATFLQGETFRFPNVAAGIDALVTIVTLNGTSLPTLDDNGSNPNAFQPQSAFNLVNIGDQAYTEFRFDFVTTGGTVGVNDVIIPDFFVNFNDVDGNNSFGEQNWSQLPIGYFAENPTELTIETVDNFVVGTSGNVEYTGVTNNFPQVNYATQHQGKSSYTIRLGVVARVAGASGTGRQHNVEFDCASNFSNPSSTTTVDTDGDGLADHLDTDSDGDGCPDAVEGTAGILSSELDGNDRVPGTVSSSGVPNLVNGGSGQGAGSSTNASVSACEPTAVDDTASVDEDDTVNIDVLDDDNFGGDGPSTGTITITSGPTNGTATVNDGGTPNDPTDDTIDYTPNADYNGPDQITYEICDADGDCTTAVVDITVDPVDDTPTAVDDTASVDEDDTVNIDVLDDDNFGGDGPSTGTITITSGPTNGTATVNDGGTPNDPTDDTIDYTPNADYNGPDQITYEICDADGDCTTAVVDITVDPVDDTPTAVDDTASVDEDDTVNIDVLDDDNFGGDGPSTGTITITSGPTNGTATVNDGGTPNDPTDDTIDYTPNADYNGPDQITYEICDADGDCTTAVVDITVDPVDDTPTAVDDTASVDEDDTVNIDVLDDDNFGGDGPSTGTITITSGPTNGTATVNDGGTPNDPTDDTIDYTPNADYNGPDQITYEICDADGDCTTAVVDITVDPVDDTPTAVDDTASVDEDDTVNIDVLDDDNFGGDGPSTGTITITSGPTNGTATVNDGGTPNDPTDDTIDYTPNADYNGPDQITYEICDADGDCTTAVVDITVDPVDDTPTAVDDTASVDEDDTVNIDVLDDDNFGGDGPSTGTITITSGPTNGTATVNDGGTPNDPTDDTIDYTPNADYNGPDQITYEICDADGDCTTAVVDITVDPVDDTPTAVDDTASVDEDDTVNIDVLDDDNFGGDGPSTGTITITSGPTNGTATVNDGGTPNDPTDDTIDYTPNADYNGPDQITYEICDADGDCTTAVVDITVDPVDDTPTAVDDTASVDEDDTVNIDVLDDDNFGGDGPSTGTITITSGPTNGTATVNDGGTPNDPTDDTIDYTPNADYNGPDQITYEICDADGDCTTAVVDITVDPVDDTPTAVDDTASVDEDDTVNIDVLDDDNFGGDGPSTGTITITSGPTNGTATVNDGGTPNDPTDDTIDYTPNADYNGPDQITYEICDADGDCTTAVVDITVDPVDDTPTAVDDTASVDEDDTVNIDVLDDDNFGGDGPSTGTITITSGPTNGTATVNDGGTPNDPTDDTIDYTPNADYNGPDQITYEICDADGDCTTAVVDITVDPVDDTPTAVDDTASVDEDDTVNIDVLDDDNFGGDGPSTGTITITSGPTNGTATVNDGGTPNDPTDDTIDYTPNADYNGPDQITYEICDADGDCTTAVVDITVDPVDDTPTAVDDTASVDEDDTVNIDVLDDDNFGGDGPSTGTITITSGPTNGTATVNDGGTPNDPTDDTIDYTPNADYNGPDQITYEICDADGDCTTAVVDITVDPVDDTPTAVDDTASVDEDDTVNIDVLDDDNFGGDGPSTGTITITSGPTNGTATVNDGGTPNDPTDDTIDYTPNADYNGPDQITYEICDADGDCTTAVVDITVDPVDDTPTAVDDTASVDEDDTVNIDVLDDDNFGGDGPSTGTITITSGPTNGTATVNDGGTPNDPTDDTIDYTPNADYNGPDQITYEICDADGDCTTAVVDITVDPVDDTPTAVDDTASVDEDDTVNIDVLDDDNFGGDGPSTGTITITSGPTNGTATVNDGGTPNDPTDDTIDYTPNADYNGPDQITYEICDADGDCTTAVVDITVDPLDDDPIANNDAGSTNENVDVIINVTGNDIDSDGTIDDLTIDLDPSTPGQQSTFTVSGEGTFTDNGDGTVTFDPVPGYNNGTTTITYTVNDNDGNTSNVATISVTIPACPSSLDSDGDGLTDCEETTGIDDPNTPEDPNDYPGGPFDPNDPCDPIGIDSTDSDGDGLTDCEETTGIDDPNTPEDPNDYPGGPFDPNDPCDPIGIDSTDSDGDGLTDCEETTGIDDPNTPEDPNDYPGGPFDPNDPCDPIGIDSTDSDGDGLTDCEETTGIDDPNTPEDPNDYPGGPFDPNDPCDPIGIDSTDSDGDGLTDCEETTGIDDPNTPEDPNDYPGGPFDPNDPCDPIGIDSTDSDGDGLTDCEETTGIDDPNTPEDPNDYPGGPFDPNDPCDPIGIDSTDSDGDGLTDCEETTGIDDPNTPEDPNDYPGGPFDPNDPCDPIGIDSTDSDGDGLTDCEETTGIDDPNTPEDPNDYPGGPFDPNDPCDPIIANCFPVANNDGGTTDPGIDIIIDITINDSDPDGTIDDLTIDLDPSTPGQQSSFTVPGEGTFTDNGDGTVTFSPAPGYTAGTTVITYTVLDDEGNISNVATITVVVPLCTSTVDSDGDGLTDCEEITGIDDPITPENPNDYPGGPTSDPNDPCDPIGIDSTDSDGDGLTDCEETTGIDDPNTPEDPNDYPGGPFDPNDPCDPIGIDSTDSDGDGLTDCEETTGIDDPNTPEDPNDYPGGPFDPNDPCDPIGIDSTDSDGDGLTDCEETTGIDDPNTPEDPNDYPGGPFDPNDPCDPIGIDSTDSDGDGLTDCEETTGIDDPNTPEDPNDYPGGPFDPNDPCDPIGIDSTDSDGDGLTDCEETTGIDDPNTPEDPNDYPGGPFDPNDPCDPIGIDSTDSDGDGLTDCEETTGIDDPNTPEDPNDYPGGPFDPNDPCDPIGIDSTDSDGDGLTDCEETTGIDDPNTPEDPNDYPGGPFDPNDPCDPIGIDSTDSDGDGLTDCEETTGIDDPNTPEDPNDYPGGPFDPNDPCDPIGIDSTDSDGDGLTDCEETTGIDDPNTPEDPNDYPGGPFDPNDPCDPIGIDSTDSDGDGLTDCEETTGIDDPNTPEDPNDYPGGPFDPNDPCDPIGIDSTDSDGDGLTDCEETTGIDDPNTPEDPNDYPGGPFDPNDPCDPIGIDSTDSDGDGLTDCEETTGIDDPNTPEDPNDYPGGPFDPNDPCDPIGIDSTDSDGDGLTDCEETTGIDDPNTPEDPNDYPGGPFDPNDPCDPIGIDSTDSDGDGLTDCEETTGIDDPNTPEDPNDYPGGPFDPNDPCDPIGIDSTDSDGDGLTDCEETTGIDDPNTPEDPNDYPGGPFDPNDPCDPIGIDSTDSDGDGLTDCEETTGIDDPNTPEDPNDYPGGPFDPNDPCDPIGIDSTDSDGDGLTDCEETTGIDDPNTPEDPNDYPGGPFDPNDPCDPIGIDSTDSDGDGLTDCEETTGIDDPNTPEDPNDYPGGPFDPNDPCDPIGIDSTDSDGDGLTDCEETTGIDDPNTPEDPNDYPGGPFDPNDPCDPIATGCEASINVTKVADVSGTSLGNRINYIIEVENTGDYVLSNIVLVDTFTDINGNVISLTEEPTFVSSTLDSEEGTLLVGEIATYTASFTIDQAAINAGGVSNVVIARGSNTTAGTVSDTSDNGDDSDGNVSDDPTVTELGCLIVFNEFSPNGDGDNDTLIINCIGNFPNNKLEVYNRWGNLVYEKRAYNNDWDGTSNGRATVNASEKLPVGTYYYVLDFGDGTKPKVGWLYINR
ncbi:Ig-like domain-containing protein [Algibacter sp. R77976]|uniref:Ig-like domain-containing protein n=1 Tax=Algibacter sp. R77976 TaxID=3093873 RepID=UPI0037C65FC1